MIDGLGPHVYLHDGHMPRLYVGDTIACACTVCTFRYRRSRSELSERIEKKDAGLRSLPHGARNFRFVALLPHPLQGTYRGPIEGAAKRSGGIVKAPQIRRNGLFAKGSGGSRSGMGVIAGWNAGLERRATPNGSLGFRRAAE
jgi:hypothetical protein